MPHRPPRKRSAKNRRKTGDHKLDMEAAAQWPIFECLISERWRETTSLTEILVSKEPPFGGVVSCVFQVDLGCLGPKQAFVTQFRTRAEYEREFRSVMTSRNPMVEAEYCLPAKILRESIAYSNQLGFELPQAVLKTLSALGNIDKAASKCQEHIPLGAADGKPVYIAGPDDNVDRIMGILTETCGHGNFHFTAPQSPIPPDFFD